MIFLTVVGVCTSRYIHNAGFLNDHILRWLFTSVGLCSFNIPDNINSFSDFAEYDVSPVKPESFDSGIEELRELLMSLPALAMLSHIGL